MTHEYPHKNHNNNMYIIVPYAHKSSVARYSTAGESLVVLENKNITMTLTSKPAAGH